MVARPFAVMRACLATTQRKVSRLIRSRRALPARAGTTVTAMARLPDRLMVTFGATGTSSVGLRPSPRRARRAALVRNGGVFTWKLPSAARVVEAIGVQTPAANDSTVTGVPGTPPGATPCTEACVPAVTAFFGPSRLSVNTTRVPRMKEWKTQW